MMALEVEKCEEMRDKIFSKYSGKNKEALKYLCGLLKDTPPIAAKEIKMERLSEKYGV